MNNDWKWVMGAPWDPELLYEFCYWEQEIKSPFPLKLDPEFKSSLQRYLVHLIHLADFCGFQNTWARLATQWQQEGIPIDRGWMGAAIGGQLAWAGLHEVARKVFENKDAEVLDVTPLHFWALAESCQWMQLDFIPQCEEAGGLPFGDRATLENDLKTIGEIFSPITEVLQGEFDPYARIRLVKK